MGIRGHGWLRSLHFNDRVDLVQSCVYVRPSLNYADGNSVSSSGPWCPPADRVVDHAAPPPAEGDTATHLNALLAAVGLYQALATAAGAEADAAPPACSPHATQSAPPGPLRVAVLGGGGCAVPAHLFAAMGGTDRVTLEVDIVERSGGVVAAAREHFGIAALEEQAKEAAGAEKQLQEDEEGGSRSRFRLHTECAIGWLGERAKELRRKEARPLQQWQPFDVIMVDLEGGDYRQLDDDDADAAAAVIKAPPAAALSEQFLLDLLASVGGGKGRGGGGGGGGKGAVIAFNCIAGSPRAMRRLSDALRSALLGSASPLSTSISTTPTPTPITTTAWSIAVEKDDAATTGRGIGGGGGHGAGRAMHRILLFPIGFDTPSTLSTSSSFMTELDPSSVTNLLQHVYKH